MRHDRREAIISARERFIPRAAACGRGFGYAAAGVRARRLIEMVRTATRRRRLGRRWEVWRRDARPPSDSKFPIEKARGQFFWSGLNSCPPWNIPAICPPSQVFCTQLDPTA
jgi:hypothetical protein